MTSEITIDRTGKSPLRFKGEHIASSGFKDNDETETEGEYGITVNKTSGGNFVAVVQAYRSSYEEDQFYTLTAGSLEVLADELQDNDLMRIDSYNEVATHILHQLFPDDPSFVEVID
jgi:hypothetical protein